MDCNIFILIEKFGYAFSFGYDEGYKFLGGNKLAAFRWEANNEFNDYSNYGKNFKFNDN